MEIKGSAALIWKIISIWKIPVKGNHKPMQKVGEL